MKLHAFQQILFMQAEENLCKNLFLSEVDQGNLWLSLVMGNVMQSFQCAHQSGSCGCFHNCNGVERKMVICCFVPNACTVKSLACKELFCILCNHK
jgi:hypothetical protein